MKKLKFDNNGIPVLSRVDIEERAEAFLRFFDKSCLNYPKYTPFDRVCKKLKDDHGVNFVFNVNLGSSPEGYKYRGRFHIPSTTILIDESLPMGESRFNFTLAHELAHFVLHRHINLSLLKKEDEPQISDTNRNLILDHVKSDNPREWIEWQANKFAASLLLPRITVPVAVIEKQNKMGITKRIGQIYYDDQQKNRNDYIEVSTHLETTYIASRAAVKIRLKELNILIDNSILNQHGNGDFKQVSNAFPSIFGDLLDKYK